MKHSIFTKTIDGTKLSMVSPQHVNLLPNLVEFKRTITLFYFVALSNPKIESGSILELVEIYGEAKIIGTTF